MYVVTVELRIDPARYSEFMHHAKENAQASMSGEPGCIQFDVCENPARKGEVFLYKRYASDTAFNEHTKTPHSLAYDSAVRNMIVGKSLKAWWMSHPD